jgi:hypothetical protein
MQETDQERDHGRHRDVAYGRSARCHHSSLSHFLSGFFCPQNQPSEKQVPGLVPGILLSGPCRFQKPK